jgi:hypothetical protein
MKSTSKDFSNFSIKSRLVWLGALFLALFLVGDVGENRSPIASSETRFVETSESGMQIVPASCPSSPSNPDYPHDTCSVPTVVTPVPTGTGGSSCVSQQICSGVRLVDSCTGAQIAACSASCLANPDPHNFCVGRDVYRQSAPCVTNFVQSCSAPAFIGCSNGACVPAPPPATGFEPFQANSPAGVFTATGALQVRPTLVRQGERAQIYWSVRNVVSCTVTGTNGDSFTVAGTGASFISSSGPDGRLSGIISGQTAYTLNCPGVEEAIPSVITGSLTINVTPVAQEPCLSGFVRVNGVCVAQ